MTEPKEMAEMPAKKKQETEQPAGAVVKSTNGGNDLEFSIFKKDAGELSTLLKGNLGGRTLTAADLVRAPIPAGAAQPGRSKASMASRNAMRSRA